MNKKLGFNVLKKNLVLSFTALVLVILFLVEVPAPAMCYEPGDCPPGYFCDPPFGGGICVPEELDECRFSSNGDPCMGGVCIDGVCDGNEVAKSGSSYYADCYGSSYRYDSTPYECMGIPPIDGGYETDGVCTVGADSTPDSIYDVGCDSSEAAYLSPYLRSDCAYAYTSGSTTRSCDTSVSNGVYSPNGICAYSSSTSGTTYGNCYTGMVCWDGSRYRSSGSYCSDLQGCDKDVTTSFSQDGIICSNSCVGTSASDCCSDSDCSGGETCNNYQCSNPCADVSASSVFKVETVGGLECMRIDSEGDVWFKNSPVEDSDVLNEVPAEKEFIVRSSSQVVFKIDSGTCATFLRGTLHPNTASISSGSNEFQVKNSGGTIVAKIDSSGNLYAKGSIGKNCGCTPGVYNSPTDPLGHPVLFPNQNPNDGNIRYGVATSWCQINHGCTRVSDLTMPLNSGNSCECHFGDCQGKTCSTSTSRYKYTKIECSEPCSTSAQCGTGEYCTSGQVCTSMPTCAEPNVGFGYNAQESNEDIYNQCSTLGCGTGYCAGGVYSCGYYTDGLQHNCGLGRVCNFAGDCEFETGPGSCDFPCVWDDYDNRCEYKGDPSMCLQPLEM